MAEGPQGFIRARGAPTWAELPAMCRKMTEDWERLPESVPIAYAYRNPEDR